MEMLDGVDLEELVLQHGPLPAERVVYILRQACESLAEAHARGIIHRDIKPDNIYLCRRALQHDVVKVLDFGLVKHLTPETAAADARLTQPDSIAGTPAYLPPEIILGGVVDGRADIYALGCVAFWLLTGRPVFDAPTAAGLLVDTRGKSRGLRAGLRRTLCLTKWTGSCSIVSPRSRRRGRRAPACSRSGWPVCRSSRVGLPQRRPSGGRRTDQLLVRSRRLRLHVSHVDRVPNQRPLQHPPPAKESRRRRTES